MTTLNWLAIVKIGNVQNSRIEHHEMEIPTYTTHLRIREEAGTVKTGRNVISRDCGMMMIFVGFANNHGPDVFPVLNSETHQTTNIGDVI